MRTIGFQRWCSLNTKYHGVPSVEGQQLNAKENNYDKIILKLFSLATYVRSLFSHIILYTSCDKSKSVMYQLRHSLWAIITLVC